MAIFSVDPAEDDSFPTFLKVVVNHWGVLMSGFGVAFLLGLYKFVYNAETPWPIYVLIVFFFVLVACFLAWKDAWSGRQSAEKNAATFEEKAKDECAAKVREQVLVSELRQEMVEWKTNNFPDFHPTMDWFHIGSTNHGTVVSVMLTITNLGMDSIATGWRLELTVPGKDEWMAPPTHISGPLTINEAQIALSASEAIYNKANVPITKGNQASGFLLFFVPFQPTEINVSGTVAGVFFKDVKGKEYSLVKNDFPMGGLSPDGIGYHPNVNIERL